MNVNFRGAFFLSLLALSFFVLSNVLAFKFSKEITTGSIAMVATLYMISGLKIR